MGVNCQLQNFRGPLFPADTVGGGDQLPQGHAFAFDPAGRVICFILSFHNGCKIEPCSNPDFDQPSPTAEGEF
jgi:hypothetical protein